MEGTVDRISDLPDPLLLAIVSSLPTKYAVSTDILSRRWRNIWANTPHLDFDEDHFITHRPRPPGIPSKGWRLVVKKEGRRRFIDFVHQALLHWKGDTISTFRLRISYCGDHNIHIDQWSNFSINKGVKVFDLDLWGGGITKDSPNGLSYELPNYFFAYGSLSELKLNFCTFKPPSFEIFVSLTNLSLTRVQLSSEIFMNVMTSCHVLLTLHLERCYDLSYLVISDANLRLESLTIYDCEPLSGGIHLRTPKLRSFKYYGQMIFFEIEKMPCLHDVDLDFGFHEFHGVEFSQLLEDLANVKALTICSYIIQVFPPWYENQLTPFCNLTHLTLKTELSDYERPGIASMFQRSPYLKILAIEISIKKDTGDYIPPECFGILSAGQDYWGSQEPTFNCMVYHLKFVKITMFKGLKNEIELLKYILKNAMVLEKLIIIIPKKITSYSIMSRLAEEVLDYEKGSTKAEILIN